MYNFRKNTKGAVTVFVTLLLLPAVLVSGTAVDLARIHTARSIIQDANQLAANSALTQYDSLLHDLYGIFAVSENDPILAAMLDEYIKVSVFGEPGQDKRLGTLQLFYGSNITMDEPLFTDDKNLRNEDVLRRQIEEYMKFRAPVIIVKDILELLGSNTFKEDAGVIDDKLGIEAAISEIYEKYKQLYDAIGAADRCDQIVDGIAGTVGTVSSTLATIRLEFVDLKSCYSMWEKAEEPEKIDNYAARYRAILVNISSRTAGGPTGSNWSNGKWLSPSRAQGLNQTIVNAKERADNFKVKFDSVVAIAREIDVMKTELSRRIDELEQRLAKGECSEELRDALTERTGDPLKSHIERYREILRWNNIEGMANVFKNGGYDYIDTKLKPLLDSVMYRNEKNPSGASLTREQLGNAPSLSSLALSSGIPAASSIIATLAGYTNDNIAYKMPDGFMKFGAFHGNNKMFFDELTVMMQQPKIPPVKLYDGQNEAGGANAEAKQKGMINDLLQLAGSAYTGLKNDPIGAKHINDRSTPGIEKLNMLDIVELIPEASKLPVADIITDPGGSAARAGDYLLLLTFNTSVFSSYTTTRPESTSRGRDDLSGIEFPKSITGVPISPEVNYFFQSELEYLYSGFENAAKNLSAISKLIYMVRLICNYITVFSVREVSAVVTGIQTTFAWNPPLAILLGELARAAFVAAESAVDTATLRAGHKLPLIKSAAKGQWVCSPGGVVKALADTASDAAGLKDEPQERGLTYSNYLLFFFISKAVVYTGDKADAATELAIRTGDLIEWNVINYRNGVNCDEDKMAQALSSEGRFKLAEMKTDFSITTTVNMRMLFLSMIFAQNFSDSRGIGMPTTMPVTVTDHRGY